MLKVRVVGHNDGKEAYDTVELCRDHFANFGIELRDAGQSADIDWIHSFQCHTNKFDTPTVIDDEIDHGNLNPYLRQHLQDTNAVLITKPVIYRDRSIYNGLLGCGTYHGRLITERFPDQVSEPLDHQLGVSADVLAKLRLSFGYPFYKRFNLFKPIPIDGVRPIDVGFVGTISGYSSAITLHRQQCYAEMQRLAAKYQNRVYFLRGRRAFISGPHYHWLTTTKISISPWGWGERCHRDVEAMYAGCVVIKPETDFVESWPDVYRKWETYIPCRLDFSDLEEKIEMVLSNYAFWHDFAQQNSRWLREYVQPWRLGAWAKTVFEEAANVAGV